MSEQWNPWFAWFMDLIKFAITFSVSAALTLLLIDRVQNNRAGKRLKQNTLIQMQLSSLREFRLASTSYEVTSLAAYTDIYQWKSKEKTAAMQKYENDSYGYFLGTVEGLKTQFRNNKDIQEQINSLLEIHNQRHLLYDHLIDTQLSSQEILELWEQAHLNRIQFDSFLEQAKTIKNSMIISIEMQILNG